MDTPLLKQLHGTIPRFTFQSPEQHAKYCRQALACNVGVIASPTYQWYAIHAGSCLPPNVKEWLVWLTGNLEIFGSMKT